MPSTRLAQRLQQVRSRVNRLQGQRELLSQQLSTANSSLAIARTRADLLARAEQVLMYLGVSLRQSLKATIEPLCTTAMQDVWGPEAGFEILFEQTDSGRHKATIVTHSEHFSGPPGDTDGESVKELLSLVIRIALVILHYPAMAPLVIMDEPLSALDTKNLPAVGSLLQDVCRDLGEREVPLQLIFTAHHLAPMLSPWAANTVTIVKRNGESDIVAGLAEETYG